MPETTYFLVPTSFVQHPTWWSVLEKFKGPTLPLVWYTWFNNVSWSWFMFLSLWDMFVDQHGFLHPLSMDLEDFKIKPGWVPSQHWVFWAAWCFGVTWGYPLFGLQLSRSCTGEYLLPAYVFAAMGPGKKKCQPSFPPPLSWRMVGSNMFYKL